MGKPSLLFEKIEDQVVEQQIDKLKNTKIENAPAEMTPQKPEVSFDDFLKMDIRVGKIIEAERVPKSKKLLKLLVNTGIDQRTIVSGIAQYYTPENAINQHVTVLMNLAPRKIMGIESQGMILMAENSDNSFSFLQTDNPVEPGGEVS